MAVYSGNKDLVELFLELGYEIDLEITQASICSSKREVFFSFSLIFPFPVAPSPRQPCSLSPFFLTAYH